jgi:hypothetical protein
MTKRERKQEEGREKRKYKTTETSSKTQKEK